MKTLRDFSARPPGEQESLCRNTWCPECASPDLGLVRPHEYALDGRIFLEGACAQCEATIRTEIVEKAVG